MLRDMTEDEFDSFCCPTTHEEAETMKLFFYETLKWQEGYVYCYGLDNVNYRHWTAYPALKKHKELPKIEIETKLKGKK